MRLYSYDGPVLEFNRIVANHWQASTRAETERRARSNLAYQFKQQYGKALRSNVTLPGKLISNEGEVE